MFPGLLLIIVILLYVVAPGADCGVSITTTGSGCTATGTGCSREITSPNYPTANYPNSAACEWQIQVPTGYIVRMTFLDLDTESW